MFKERTDVRGTDADADVCLLLRTVKFMDFPAPRPMIVQERVAIFELVNVCD